MNDKQKVYSEFVTRPYSAEIYRYVLKHADKDFKYIRKEKKNGKWRYYYDDDAKGGGKAKPLPVPSKTTAVVDKPNLNRSLKDSMPKLKDSEPAVVTNTAKRINPNRSLKDNIAKLKDPVPVSTNTAKKINPNRSLKDNMVKLKEPNDILKKETSNKTEDTKRTAVNYGVDHGPAAKFQSIEEMPKKTETMSAEEEQKAVNPLYDPTDAYYSTNCAYCSATWDLRRRGYDVEANGASSAYDTDLEEIASWYGAELNDFRGFGSSDMTERGFKTCSNIMNNTLKSEGEGAYGNFVMYWNTGGAHSVVWSVENGEVMIRDTQLNTTTSYNEYMESRKDYLSAYVYLRTDNREITPAILEVARRREKRANVS